jgi:hypothetical protein
MPPSQSSDPVDRPRLRAPAHLTSFNPKSKEIPVEGNSGAPVSFDVSQGDPLPGIGSVTAAHRGTVTSTCRTGGSLLSRRGSLRLGGRREDH